MAPSRVALVSAYLGACLIWGSTWMAIKVGLRGAAPLTSIAVRMTIAALIVLVILRVRHIALPGERRFVRIGVFLGFFHIVLPYSLVYYGEQHIPSGLAAVLYAAMPLVVALIARMALGERLTPRKIMGILSGILGVAVIFSDSLRIGSNQAIGAAAVTCSMLAASIGSVATKRWAYGYHPLASLMIPFSVGAAATWLLALILEGPVSLHFDTTTWATIIYLAVAGSVTALGLFFFVIQHLEVTVVSYQTFIIPIVAVLLGWAILGETITARVALGAVMILAGVSLAIFAPRSRARRNAQARLRRTGPA